MLAPRILIIEDDVDLARLLSFDLEAAGFTVEHVPTAMRGLTRARECPPALIVLDLGLPDFDGTQVVARLRRSRDAPPIIVVSARDTAGERVRLLTLGARDYLVKPYDPAELVARIHCILRRTAELVTVWGALELCPQAQVARYEGRELRLTRLEFRLLSALLQVPGRVYSVAELTAALWPDREGFSAVVVMHVSNLRRKLLASGGARVLRTVRGVGYAVYPQPPLPTT